jgi:succinate-acetate transporter protein
MWVCACGLVTLQDDAAICVGGMFAVCTLFTAGMTVAAFRTQPMAVVVLFTLLLGGFALVTVAHFTASSMVSVCAECG